MAGEIGSIYVDVVANTAKFHRNVDRATKKLDSFGQQAREATRLLGGIALGAAVVKLAGDTIKAADTMTLLTSRIKLVSESNEDAARRQEDVFRAAQKTRSEYEATVTLYTRIARSTKSLGLEQSKQLAITEAINKAIKVSGATTQEAQAAIIQLSQGMAAGALRGQELNSVMEQTPRLAEAIAAGMGLTIGQLREFGKEGKLTSEAVVNALLSQTEAIDREFKQMPITVGDATTKIKNSFLVLVGEGFAPLNNALADSLSNWADFIDKLTTGTTKEEEFNKLQQRKIELIEEQKRGWGFIHGFNEKARQRDIEATKLKLRLLSDEKTAQQKLEGSKEENNKQDKISLDQLTAREELIRENLSLQEKASFEIDKQNALWLGGITSVEAYEQALLKAFKAWDESPDQERLTKLETSLLSEEERIHASYARRNEMIAKAFADEEEMSDRHLDILFNNNVRYQDALTNLEKKQADERDEYDRKVAAAKRSLEQSTVSAIYSIAVIAGKKYFKYAQRVDAAITLLKAYKLAAGAASDTTGDVWTRAAAYGSALAMGLSAVAKIKQSNIGSSSGSVSIPSPSVPSQPQQAAPATGEQIGMQAVINIIASGRGELGDTDRQTVKDWLLDIFENDSIVIKRDSAQAFEIQQATGT